MPISIPVLILLFILAEIAVFILVGGMIGVGATLGLVLLALVAGAVLLRRQGLATAVRVRAEFAAGRAPTRPLIDGGGMALAALLLIVPGFLTDAAALALFVPAVRQAIWRRIARRFDGRARRPAPLRPARGTVVIELGPGEYDASAPRDGGWRPEPPDR